MWLLQTHSFVTLLASLLIFVSLSGCQKRVAPKIGQELLSDANRALESGNYLKAAQLYRAYIDSEAGSHKQLDRVLFQHSLALMGAEYEHREGDRCQQGLNRLLQEYPESSFRMSAQALLSFHNRLHQLQQRLHQSNVRLESQMKSLSSLNQRIATLEAHLEGSKEEATLLQSHLDIRRERIEGLSKELSERERQVSLLQAELLQLKEKMRQLKKIDFETLENPGPENGPR